MNNKWIPIEEIYELSWRDTLKELSFDGDNMEYMSHSLEEAVDFDRVARHYEKKWKLNGARPSSADALIATEDRLVLVEFKNGTLGVPEIRGIRKKIRDSILVFCDLTDSNMRYTRGHMEFILVYNQEKTAKSKTKLHFSKKAGKELVLFGLGIYQGSHFLNVHTMTGAEFDGYLAQSLGLTKVELSSDLDVSVEEAQEKVESQGENTPEITVESKQEKKQAPHPENKQGNVIKNREERQKSPEIHSKNPQKQEKKQAPTQKKKQEKKQAPHPENKQGNVTKNREERQKSPEIHSKNPQKQEKKQAPTQKKKQEKKQAPHPENKEKKKKAPQKTAKPEKKQDITPEKQREHP